MLARRRDDFSARKARLCIGASEDCQIVGFAAAACKNDRTRATQGAAEDLPRAGKIFLGIHPPMMQGGGIAVMLARKLAVKRKRRFRYFSGCAVVEVNFSCHFFTCVI
ncbi:MAG: GNAT family N-acetyltransferase [Clostridia bacterium]|nr:GNAT family N-acetyltransferase [Clostridia bacterium]